MEKHHINVLKARGRPINYEKTYPESTDNSNIEKICQGYFVFVVVVVGQWELCKSQKDTEVKQAMPGSLNNSRIP